MLLVRKKNSSMPAVFDCLFFVSERNYVLIDTMEPRSFLLSETEPFEVVLRQ